MSWLSYTTNANKLASNPLIHHRKKSNEIVYQKEPVVQTLEFVEQNNFVIKTVDLLDLVRPIMF
jgi:hypothetical protein